MVQSGGREKENTPVPCRLAFMLARDADVGIIVRRGPSSWTQLVRWDTADDRFERGQWVRGRIYTPFSDLSADGQLFLCHLRRGGVLETLITRPPYLTPLASWPEEYDGPHGGYFADGSQVVLDSSHRTPAAPEGWPAALTLARDWAAADYRPIWARHLLRNSWAFTDPEGWEQHGSRFRLARPRPQSEGGHCPAISLAIDTVWGDDPAYTLHHPNGRTPLAGLAWADWDRRGRLVFARAGKMWAAEVSPNGEVEERQLLDLDAATPEEGSAPEWAAVWPSDLQGI